MGIFAGLFFLGGLAVSLMLMAWGIAAHRKTTAANGQDNSWFRFGLLSVGLTLATIIVTALLLFPGNHAGAPTGNDYIGMLLLAGLLGASPGVGVRLASSVMRSPQEKQEQEQEQEQKEEQEQELSSIPVVQKRKWPFLFELQKSGIFTGEDLIELQRRYESRYEIIEAIGNKPRKPTSNLEKIEFLRRIELLNDDEALEISSRIKK